MKGAIPRWKRTKSTVVAAIMRRKRTLRQHIGSCVADDLRAGSDEKLEELLQLLPKLMK